MPNKTEALLYANENLPKFKSDLEDLVKIPSVSTDPNHTTDIRKTADWLKSKLSDLGFQETKIIETDGHPAVYGSYQVGPNAKTVLIYGHYDVQPADPIDLWKTEPFEPIIKDQRMYGRGASDMKGQIIASLAAVESMLKSGGAPVNIKYIIEGEEEIGSPNLAKALEKHADLLRCDVILNPDAGMISPTSPTIVYGLRGLAYFEIIIKGPNRDLHSGMFGGIVQNPAIVLSKLIAGMVNEDGVIQLPGYYDSVEELSLEERTELSRLPIKDEDLKEQTGAKKLHGEIGYTSVERVGARPTLDVNGMLSGFTGKGSKTIIPAWAMAKVSMRLVPHQDPKVVHQQLVTYIQNNVPDTVEWEVIQHAGGPAAITNREHPGVKALSEALEEIWHQKPFFKREGGSIPVVTEMQQIIGTESVLSGFGLPGDNIHSPNESLHIPTWEKGILALILFFYNYAGGYEN
ncbi:MAG: peptidase M20 [Anaerolineaceae bacterium]|nr:peptidase M20 [Anaerolineaceae bacterium]